MINHLTIFAHLVASSLFLFDWERYVFMAYGHYSSICVKRDRFLTWLHGHEIVYFGDDQIGAYVIIKNVKVYLKVFKAKPLKGFLAGENYYTTKESERFVEVVDNDF